MHRSMFRSQHTRARNRHAIISAFTVTFLGAFLIAGLIPAPILQRSAIAQVEATAVDIKVNFQDQATTPPAGYLPDWGEPYGARNGLTYGWVAPGTSTPRSLVGLGRVRNGTNSDVRLTTFMHMQGNDPNNPDPNKYGSWEVAVSNGKYNVTVSAGDGLNIDSVHEIRVEGQIAVADFIPTQYRRWSATTVTVNVNDGRLTLDASGGKNTKINYVTIASTPVPARPYVSTATPSNSEINVSRDAFVSAEVSLPNVGAGVDEATLTPANVQLVRADNGAQVTANINTSGGGDVIVLQPTALLEPNVRYRFLVREGVKDTSGASFLPFESVFTTGSAGGNNNSGIVFDKIVVANGQEFTSVVIGPDNRLYAGTMTGNILRYPINGDGSLGSPQIIDTISRQFGAQFVIGLAFRPGTNELWVTHNAAALANAPDWTGKISRLTGANYENLQLFVTNLPRSARDHLTNSLAFGPDGGLYVVQGSMSAMGAPDNAWGQRAEHLLSGAILRINTSGFTGKFAAPLDVKTEAGGAYNPFESGAPVTLYATGIRNAYDLVWHSNGQLYVPTNGSAAGGNIPASNNPLPASCQNRIDKDTNGPYTGPQVAGVTNVTVSQDDWLFRVVKGGYYGHPNPLRCEWVAYGGNPTNSRDTDETAQYPVGTQPDRNYRGASYNFGKHYSPNGVIEYKSNVFNGALKGKLLVVRYSGGDDIIVLAPGGANQDIVDAQVGNQGMSGFNDPLDIIENTANGQLYVTELAGKKITLLRPRTAQLNRKLYMPWTTK